LKYPNIIGKYEYRIPMISYAQVEQLFDTTKQISIGVLSKFIFEQQFTLNRLMDWQLDKGL